MNVLVIGTGYVGTTTGLVLCENGHKVIGLDIDKNKIDSLNEGKLYFYEKGLDEVLVTHLNRGNISFTTEAMDAIQNSDIIFICVGTPKKEDGKADLQYVTEVAKLIGRHINNYKIIVIKSTVPVGTAEMVTKIIMENNRGYIPFDVVSNPEFLREGNALSDATKPDRIIIGSSNMEAAKMVSELYTNVMAPIVITSPKTAELIKYASNSFLALKISFINELSTLCDYMNIDIDEISLGMGLDHRIGPYFLKAGIGYGGSCFPKDVDALLTTSKEYGVNLSILERAVCVNQSKPLYFIDKVARALGELKNKRIAVLGLAFKSGTDDTRESPSLQIIEYLLNAQCIVRVHDPVVTTSMKEVEQFTNVIDTVREVDAVLICTDWDEYKQLDWNMIKEVVKQPFVFDGRNMLNKGELEKLGIRYQGIGKPKEIL
ncbi:UDP-glucose/GDP-mannose dehydrogenase family protein [Bacillus sp. JJ1566]|uniref:UDP-glucose dehydrogenase family protein n=1 Tax=Bacillus sp. JJ1566 TaxID=3122961 RepID=UPI003000C9D9